MTHEPTNPTLAWHIHRLTVAGFVVQLNPIKVLGTSYYWLRITGAAGTIERTAETEEELIKALFPWGDREFRFRGGN
jgi:hypothetical protein